MKVTYTVVQNSGHFGDIDLRNGFRSAAAAWKWAERKYARSEIKELHIEVRAKFMNAVARAATLDAMPLARAAFVVGRRPPR
jgi:hypothetical protein